MSDKEIGVELRLLSPDNTSSSAATARVRLRYGTGVYDHADLTPIAAEQLAGALLDAAKRARTARAAISGARARRDSTSGPSS